MGNLQSWQTILYSVFAPQHAHLATGLCLLATLVDLVVAIAILLEHVALTTAAAQSGNLSESLDHFRLLPSVN